jgi:rhodanese/phosphatase family protein
MHIPLKNIFILNITILFSIAMYAADPHKPTRDTVHTDPDQKSMLTEWGQWAYSVVSFIPTIHGNDYFGQGPCSFHRMLEPYDPTRQKPRIVLNDDDEIISIYDGKKAPLFLGNIPRSSDHFKKLRKECGLEENALIGLHTLNRKFERKYVWLKDSAQNDGHVKRYYYDTTDCTAPSQIDIIRCVFDLTNRDEHGELVVLLHCKAGKGRSGTVMIAYYIPLWSIAEKVYANGTPYTKTFSNSQIIDAFISYGQKNRTVLKINSNQRPSLDTFLTSIQAAGNIQTLYTQNIEAISKRETELKKH